MKPFLLSLVFLSAAAVPGVRADDAAQAAQAQANEQRLRDTLRATTQQLRTSEAEKAGLLAGQTERDEKIATLEARVASLAKQSAEDKAAADKTAAGLRDGLLRQEQEVARLSTSLDKWKKAYQQAADVARKTETARAKLNTANIALERKVTERETQNLALYATAREILERYTGFSLGRSLAAREPFTGIAKARIEEQIQDYADKLEDNKLKPQPADSKPSTKAAP